ncbi:hypothetical protein BH11MYX4_BH11MYX4_17000 [soil metagenome]
MNTLNRFKAPVALAIAAILPVLACSSVTDAQGALCCTEFKAGAAVTADIGGSAKAQVAVQAVADFSGIAAAAITDLTTACRSMAQDLDAPAADLAAAEAKAPGKDQMDAYCKVAVSAIATVKASAGGTLKIDFVPPACEASVSAKGSCQAKCDVSGKCDIKANPPKCTGGSLEVSCKGSCEAKAGVALHCEGSCSANCTGSCTASGGVKCQGKCEGTCEGAGGAGTNGVDAQGNCQGTCKGTCSVTAPSVKCEGSCKGECSASCTGTAEASVKCDGECKADYEPLKCSGGKLEGGCQVDAKCDASCDASVSAKAECTPPSVTVTFTGAANIEAAAKLKGVFEANLGVVLAFKARLEGMAKLTATISGSADAVVDIKAACIPAVVAAAVVAVENVGAAASASASIATSAQ